MGLNFSFLSAASNAILKPGGLLKWKKRLAKDIRLLLQLKEVMKIVRLTSSLAFSIIAKAKAEAWQATCSSLSLKSDSKSVYFLLHSVTGSSS